jgi:hypothetical protein
MSPPAGMGSTQTVYPDKAPFDPLSLNPSLWLDAQKISSIHLTTGKVSQYDDQSVNAFNYVQGSAGARPTPNPAGINGHNTLTYTHTDPDSMTMTGGVPAGQWQNIIGPAGVYTIFLVWKYTGAVVRNGDPLGNDPNIFTDQGGGGPWNGATCAINSGDGTKVDVSTFMWNGSAYVEATTTGVLANAHYSTHVFDGTNLRVALEQNVFVSTVLGGAGFVGTSATPVATGASTHGAGPAMQGDEGEIFVFPYVMSAPNMLLMQQYLAAKWSI